MRAHTLDIHCIMLLFVGYKAPGVLALMGHTYCGILQLEEERRLEEEYDIKLREERQLEEEVAREKSREERIKQRDLMKAEREHRAVERELGRKLLRNSYEGNDGDFSGG